MGRILLSCVCAAVLLLPAAAAARPSAHPERNAGFLVVRRAAGDGGPTGKAVVTAVVRGFVLGRVSGTHEARVEIYHLPSAGHESSPQAVGVDVSRTAVRWHGLPGTEFNGSGFRFLALGGFYRVVVRGSGVYLFAGGRGNVTLRGSSAYPHADGTYSIDGAFWRSLPSRALERRLGKG
jgi:hypothetical protein